MASAIQSGPSVVSAFGAPALPSWSLFATGVLDLLREAVLVLGRDARLLGSNRVADELLAERDGLALLRGGVVASTPDATRALWPGVERAAHGPAGSVRVPRAGRSPLRLRIEPPPRASAAPAAAVVLEVRTSSRSETAK